MSDLVSIITPSYNDEEYIRETIESVLSQTYNNWEMIIVDDCSQDNTVDVIKSFEDNRIKLFVNDCNSGPAASRNKAIIEAKGKYIAFLDADDMWKPEKLEKQIAFMKNNNYSFSYTNYYVVDENLTSLGLHISGPRIVNKTMLHCYNWIGCLTVMYDAEKVGLIQIPNIRKRNDWAIWLKVVEKAKCHLLNEELSVYRKRLSSVSKSNRFKMVAYHYEIYRNHLDKGFVSSHIMVCINMICLLIKNKVYNRYE